MVLVLGRPRSPRLVLGTGMIPAIVSSYLEMLASGHEGSLHLVVFAVSYTISPHRQMSARQPDHAHLDPTVVCRYIHESMQIDVSHYMQESLSPQLHGFSIDDEADIEAIALAASTTRVSWFACRHRLDVTAC